MTAVIERPLIWLVSECYPHPAAPHRCAFAHRQMVGLVQAGCDVHALIPNGWYPAVAWRLASAWRRARAGAIPDGWTLDGIPVRSLPVQNRVPSRLSRPLDHSARVRDALVMALARAARKPDILLSQFALPYGWAVREAAKSFDLPYVIHLRGDDVWIWPHLSMRHMDQFRGAVRDAALVLGVSQAIIDEGVRLVGGDVAGTAVVPNGIDLERFRPADTDARGILRAKLGITRSELALLCVAPALAAKGWTELLDAIGQLPDDFAPLVLVGAISRLRVELDLHAEAARRAPRVRLVLRQNAVPEEMVELYQAADVFALASRSEGMSNAVLEAMATALPVVTTNVGGHAEVIDHGVNGMLAGVGDTAAFRDCLAAMLVSVEARCGIGAAARLRAERIGSSRQAGRRLAAIFERVRRCDSLVDLTAENPYGAGSGASQLASSAGVD